MFAILAALSLYWLGPDPVTATSVAEIEAPPEVVFDQFVEFEAWYELVIDRLKETVERQPVSGAAS